VTNATTTHLRRVRVLGQDVRVAVRPGTATGPPLVLCNGIGASLDLLEPFVSRLPPELEVVSFDVPGVGGSSLPRVPYNFALLSMFLGRLLRELGYDTVDMLGISWGGGLAQQFAFQNPRRCRRLVLVSTGTGSLMVPAHPRVLAKMLTPRRYRDPDFAVSIAATLYGGQLRDHPQLAQRLLHDQSRLGSSRGYVLQLAAGAGWTSLPFLPLLRQQTLVLAGDDDPIIPLVNARLINRLLPHSRLHVFNDGHLGLVTCAAELGPIVGSFLGEPD
jgi:poly(3-hydroxyalkanoate) depolymerase